VCVSDVATQHTRIEISNSLSPFLFYVVYCTCFSSRLFHVPCKIKKHHHPVLPMSMGSHSTQTPTDGVVYICHSDSVPGTVCVVCVFVLSVGDYCRTTYSILYRYTYLYRTVFHHLIL